MMIEALFPSDVSANTSGAILFIVATGLAALPWLTARDAWIAPIAAKAAATRNNEQKIRRHRDGVNVDAGFEFVIVVMNGRRNHPFKQAAENCQSFSCKFTFLLGAGQNAL